eukprot:102511_1
MNQSSLINDLVNTFDESDQVTVEAPVNIAITKYWGKRDPNLNIPLNDSISITLDMQCMCTQTTITINRNQNTIENKNKNSISLNNGTPIPFNQRINNLITAIHQYLMKTKNNSTIFNDIITIKSMNNFPTAAGLASSASGYAALAKGLCILYGINDDKIITIIARHGSGSASRSLHSGFVKWFALNPNKSEYKNNDDIKIDIDPFDSYAQQLFDDKHWIDLKVIICVASSKEKEIGSSVGQILSAQTSELLPQRLKNVKQRDILLQNAIKQRNFDQFAYISMKDSSEFHAICLDTFPPIFYLNDTSRAVIKLCHLMNDWYKNKYVNNNGDEYMVCYTFDAGPNAVLVTRNSECLNIMMKAIKNTFFNGYNNNGLWIEDKLQLWNGNDKMDIEYPQMKGNGVEKVILTRIGPGARVVQKI